MPAHIAHVRGTHALLELQRLHVRFAAGHHAWCDKGLPNRIRERALLRRVGNATQGSQVLVDQLRQRVIAQKRIVAVHHFMGHGGAGAEGRGLRSRHDALEHGLGDIHAGVANVVIDLRRLRHDVRRRPAIRDDVVDARVRGDVLAHEVHHEVHGLHPIKGGPALGRGRSRVGGLAVEAEPGRLVGRAARSRRVIAIRRMPMQHDIDVIEQSGARHVYLAGTALFRRCAVNPHFARPPDSRQPIRQGCARGDGRAAEQVMATGMAGAVGGAWRPLGAGRLGEARQGVELGQDADDWRARSPRRRERRGHVRHAALHGEAPPREEIRQAPGAPLLLIAELRELPNVLGHGDGAFLVVPHTIQRLRDATRHFGFGGVGVGREGGFWQR